MLTTQARNAHVRMQRSAALREYVFWEHVCGVADGSHDSTALSHCEETPHVCFHTLPTPGRGVNAATQAPKINTATILYRGLSVNNI